MRHEVSPTDIVVVELSGQQEVQTDQNETDSIILSDIH